MEERKFYEETLHEEKLPNNKGQYNNGRRRTDEDWYGNKMVKHSKRTYLGDFLVNLSPAELKGNAKKVFDYTNNQVYKFIKRLSSLVPDAEINPDKIEVILRRKYGHPDIDSPYGRVYAYEDDGNTKTEGFAYDIYWVVKLSDRNSYIENALVNGYAVDVIYFHMVFTERIHDGQLSGRFFSLYFNGLSKDDCERIDHNNNNMVINSIITPFNLYKTAKKLIEFKQDSDLYNKAIAEFEKVEIQETQSDVCARFRIINAETKEEFLEKLKPVNKMIHYSMQESVTFVDDVSEDDFKETIEWLTEVIGNRGDITIEGDILYFNPEARGNCVGGKVLIPYSDRNTLLVEYDGNGLKYTEIPKKEV